MSLGGWVKVHRALSDHHISSDPATFSIWIHLLLLANHKETKRMINGRVIAVQAGQLITSRKSLAAKTGVNESKVERVLTALKNEQQIEQHGTSKFRVISIVKWADYQSDEQQNEQQVDSKRTADEQQMNTPEEVSSDTKNDKNGKKTDTQVKTRVNWFEKLTSLGVDEAHAKDWLAVRKAKKAQMTETALQGVQREAEIAGITLAAAVKISAENSWQGFKASWLINSKGINNGQYANSSGPVSAVGRVKAKAAERERARQGAAPEYFGQGDFIEGEFSSR